MDEFTPEQQAELKRIASDGKAEFRRQYEQWKAEQAKED